MSQWKIPSAPCGHWVGRERCRETEGFHRASRAPAPPRQSCGALIHARGREELCRVRAGFCLRKDLQGLRDRKNCSGWSSKHSNAAFSLVVGKNPP